MVESPAVKDRLREVHPFAGMLQTAALAIVVCALPEAQKKMCPGFFPLDCGAAVENLLLQAAELGYGTCWCGCWPNEEQAEAVREVLGAKSLPVGLVAVGVPDEAPPARGFYEPAKVTFLRG